MKTQYGLHIYTRTLYGTPYIYAQIVRREENRNQPLGCSSVVGMDATPRHMRGMALDGLGMRGFISEYDQRHIGFEPDYSDVYSMDQRKLVAMLKTIKRINSHILADRSTSAGAVFLSFVKALRLSFVVTARGGAGEYIWMSIEDGHRAYLDMVTTEERNEKAKKGAAA